MGIFSKIKERRMRKKRLAMLRSDPVPVEPKDINSKKPMMKFVAFIAAIVIAVGGAIYGIYQGINYLQTVLNPLEREETVDVDAAQTPDETDLTDLPLEMVCDERSINDPYMSGEEIVYSTTKVENGSETFKKLCIYNTKTEETQEIAGIEVKYDNILEPKLAGDYIFWLDSMEDGGGRICGFDRKQNKMFVIKEYAMAAPIIEVCGTKLAFMQQAQSDLDRLYLYDLETREGVIYKIFSQAIGPMTSAGISEDGFMWLEHDKQDGLVTSKICCYSFDTAAEKEIPFDEYVATARMNGDDFAYLISSGDQNELYVLKDGEGEVKIAENVTNYQMGDGFVAFTKDDMLYLYYIDAGTYAVATKDNTKVLLASVNGRYVCFYDVAAGMLGLDVVKYFEVP